jgi:hypothetical protein
MERFVMVRNFLIASAVTGALLASNSAYAAISLSSSRTPAAFNDGTFGALDLIQIRATGSGPSTYIIGVNFDAVMTGTGTPYAYWNTTTAGAPRVSNISGISGRSAVDFNAAAGDPGSTTNIAARRPTTSWNLANPGTVTGRIGAFGAEGNAIADAGGGFASFPSIVPGPVTFMQFYVSPGAGIDFTKMEVGNQTGTKFVINGFSVPAVGGPTNTAPSFTGASKSAAGNAAQVGTVTYTAGGTPVITVNINFGSLSTAPAAYSVDVAVTDPDTGNTLTLTPGTLPSGITATGSSAAGTGARNLTVSGTVSTLLRGSFDVPLTLNDGVTGGLEATSAGILRFVVIPEPTTLGLLAGVSLVGLRRRK